MKWSLLLSEMDSSNVEQERLLAVIATQRQHISELKQQLQETLDVQRRQHLELVQQSPARRSVRKLLEQAAVDNTALSRRVEELRAQRNALNVTKAALTAQVSELIRLAGDERQKQEQHRLVLQQLNYLCRLMQLPHLHHPSEQMAAVVSHIKQLYRERQELKEQLGELPPSSSNAPWARTPTADTQAASMTWDSLAPPCSPTGRRLDQQATSHLIWSDDCSGTGSSTAELDRMQRHQHRAAHANQQHSNEPWPSSASCSLLCQSHTHLLDMSYISPLRGHTTTTTAITSSSTTHTVGVMPGTGALSSIAQTAGGASAANGLTPVSAVVDAGTPLSAQSLSAFSPPTGPRPSPRMRQALQQLSPLRRCGLHRSMASSSLDTDRNTKRQHLRSQKPLHSNTDASPVQNAAAADVAAAHDKATGACSSASCLATPASRSGAFGSSVSVAGSCSPLSVHLNLQPEFKIAAAGDLWPSPATAGSSWGFSPAALTSGHSIGSHQLWLPEAELQADDTAEEGGHPEELDIMFPSGHSGHELDMSAEAEVHGSEHICSRGLLPDCQAKRRVSGSAAAAAVKVIILCAGLMGGVAVGQHRWQRAMQLLSAAVKAAAAAAAAKAGDAVVLLKHLQPVGRHKHRSDSSCRLQGMQQVPEQQKQAT